MLWCFLKSFFVSVALVFQSYPAPDWNSVLNYGSPFLQRNAIKIEMLIDKILCKKDIHKNKETTMATDLCNVREIDFLCYVSGQEATMLGNLFLSLC